MAIKICPRDLPAMPGTFLAPEGPLPSAWGALKEADNLTLILAEGAGSAALALKVWPDLVNKIKYLIYVHNNICPDPEGVESLLNCGQPLVICDNLATALDFAAQPDEARLTACGVHMETDRGSIFYGRLISDLESDHKFPSKNARLLAIRL